MERLYAGSVAATRLRERAQRARPCRLALFDIDSTLSGSAAGADAVRALLVEQGYVVGFVTSRTEEMLLSRPTYLALTARGFHRPVPKLGREGERRVYVPPEEAEPAGILDGEVIAGSSGTRILLRQGDGSYGIDTQYEARFGASPARWRERKMALVAWTRSRGCLAEPAPIDSWEKYEAGEADVAPPDYRIQIDLPSLREKLCFLREVEEARRGDLHGARGVRITDDSDPAEDHWKVILTPRRGSKAHATEAIVRGLCAAAAVERASLHILFAGDSFPDLLMGLLGGLGTHGRLLLVGGSRLSAYLTGGAPPEFAGEPLQAYLRRLAPLDRRGYYRFRLPWPHGGARTLVVGDQAFGGTEAVETVEAYLRAGSGGGEESGVAGGRPTE